MKKERHCVGGAGSCWIAGKEAGMCLTHCVRAILNQDLHLNGDSESPLCRLGGVSGVVLDVKWRNDAALPRFITLTPLLLAAIFAASEQGVVSADRLQEVLEEVSRNGELRVYDRVVVFHTTVKTT